MVKHIFSFEIMAVAKSRTPRYVVYYMGQEDSHIMDWRGCNYRRIKAPNQPVFTKIKTAYLWAQKNCKECNGVDGIGEHVADQDNYIEARTVAGSSDPIPPELTQEEWEMLRDKIRDARLHRERCSY